MHASPAVSHFYLPCPFTLIFSPVRMQVSLVSRQKYACRDKTFVSTKYFCHDSRDKYVFVTTKHVFCRDKIMQVLFLSRQSFCRDKRDKYLSRQAYFCRDRRSRDKTYTSLCLSISVFVSVSLSVPVCLCLSLSFSLSVCHTRGWLGSKHQITISLSFSLSLSLTPSVPACPPPPPPPCSVYCWWFPSWNMWYLLLVVFRWNVNIGIACCWPSLTWLPLLLAVFCPESSEICRRMYL